MQNVLLLFTSQLPCWDEETITLAGENPDSLKELEASGDVIRLGKSYVLTEKGINSREAASRENFVPVDRISRLITDINEANEALELNRMTQYLDRAFMTDWGIKEFAVNEVFPIVPDLNDNEYFAFDGERIKALWPNLKIIESFMKTFPNCDYNARKLPAPGQRKLDEWAEINNARRGTLKINFVLRHRHDFNHYRQFKRPEGDLFKFVNSSMIFAQKFNGDYESLPAFIGKLHIFLMGQRRVFIPGWFDMDCEDQETWKLLTLVTDTDSELETLTKTLRKWDSDLIEPARPLFLIGTSIEHMRNQKAPQRMFYDWFQEETVKILRPDVQDI